MFGLPVPMRRLTLNGAIGSNRTRPTRSHARMCPLNVLSACSLPVTVTRSIGSNARYNQKHQRLACDVCR